MMLNLGCGGRPLDKAVDIGDVNADVELFPHLTVRCDSHCLPFRDGVFTRVVANCLLEHVANPLHTMREIKRVLKRGGNAEVMVPNLWEWRRILSGVRWELRPPDCDHKQGWDYLEMQNLVHNVGLRVRGGRWLDWYGRQRHRLDGVLRALLPPALYYKEVVFTLENT